MGLVLDFERAINMVKMKISGLLIGPWAFACFLFANPVYLLYYIICHTL